MSEALVPVITRAGLAAIVAAQANGLQGVIDRVAVGRGARSGSAYVGYTPSKSATALANELVRVPILAGSRLDDPVGFRILAQVPKAESADVAIREVGFFLATGELFAVWSDPAMILAYRTRLADIDLSLELTMEQIPRESITLTVLDPDIPDTTGVLAELLSCTARTFIADLDAERRAVARGIY